MLSHPVHVPPQGGVGGLEAEDAGEQEVEELALPEPDVLMPGPAEPRYPARDRQAPDRLAPAARPPQKRGRKK